MLDFAILNGTAPALTHFLFAQLPVGDAIKWIVLCGLLLVALVLLWQTPPSQSETNAAPLSSESYSVEADGQVQKTDPPNPFVLDPALNLFGSDSSIATPHPSRSMNPQLEHESAETEPAESMPGKSAIEEAEDNAVPLQPEAIDPDPPSLAERLDSELPPQRVPRLKASSSWSTWDELAKQSATDRREEPLSWGGVPLTWSTWDQLAQQNMQLSSSSFRSVIENESSSGEPSSASSSETEEDIERNSKFHEDD